MNKEFLNRKISECEKRIKYYNKKISAIDDLKEKSGLDIVGFLDKDTFIVSADTDIELDKFSVKTTENLFYGCVGYLTYYKLKDKIKYTKYNFCKIKLFNITYGRGGPGASRRKSINILDYSNITDKIIISKIEKCIINKIISKKISNISGYNSSKFSQLLIFM